MQGFLVVLSGAPYLNLFGPLSAEQNRWWFIQEKQKQHVFTITCCIMG